MASGDLLKKLFRSFKQRDIQGFNEAALEVIAEEKRKNHSILADDLQKILNNGASDEADLFQAHRPFEKLPKDRDKGSLLVEVKTSKLTFDDLVLNEQILSKLEAIVKEFYSARILKSYGVRPKQKILFAGPPGCGKSITAEALATELALPLLYTRFDAVISSYLGETAGNLRKVFDFASSGTWIVLFDEFDAIGKSRENPEEHGELKRVVNTFLQLLDNFFSDGLVIAATNHEGLLDNAIWRRFDEIIYFDKPTDEEKIRLIEKNLRGFSHKYLSLSKLVSRLAGWTHADIERATVDAVKMAILSGEDNVSNSMFEKALRDQQDRIDVVAKNY